MSYTHSMKLKFSLLFALYTAFFVAVLALPSLYGALLMLAVMMVIAGIAAYYDNKKEKQS